MKDYCEDKNNCTIENCSSEACAPEVSEDTNNQINELKDALLKAQSDADKYQRVLAALTNETKIKEKAREHENLNIKVNIFKNIIPCYSALVQGLNSVTDDNIKQGIQMILDTMTANLAKSGVKKMNTQAGDVFNAETDSIISTTKAPSPEQVGQISQIISSGFILSENGKTHIISNAQVIVFN